jgi:hypothetical protein
MNGERNNERNKNENPASKPDPGTLHTTDPQENREGPVSSLMHDTGNEFDSDETKQEADKEKDESM